RDVETHYRFDRAKVILALDADFLACGPGHLRYVHDFSAERRVRDGKAAMNRLYAIEPTPTLTGAAADHRLTLRPSQMEGLARALAARLGVAGISAPESLAGVPAAWLDAVAANLHKYREASVVLVGDPQPAAVHALAHAMNHVLRNSGETVFHTDPVEIQP